MRSWDVWVGLAVLVGAYAAVCHWGDVLLLVQGHMGHP